jgi:hypothetical protein
MPKPKINNAMKVALVFPPTCDPTAPYISVPALSAYLRSHGVTVVPVDANVEAYERLLRKAALEKTARRLRRRFLSLDRKASLNHEQQLVYGALASALPAARDTPARIEHALAVLRDPADGGFFDPAHYDEAVATVEDALGLISAAYAPLSLGFSTCRTPFALLNAEEIERDAGPDRNPFYEYFSGELSGRLAAERVSLIGISVAFASQIQPAYGLAYVLRQQLPGVHLTIGGTAITQLFARSDPAPGRRMLGPFHTAILFEGEKALLDLVCRVGQGEQPEGIIRPRQYADLKNLPCPDFDGMPLEKYFAPQPVLPYDPTRGCYWGRCAFCHYGLAERGTAPYRERPVEQVIEHLRTLAQKHKTTLFYLSQDSLAPQTALRIARAVRASGQPWRWSTDMRAEPALTRSRCRELGRGGLLSVSLGIESAAPRVVRLIDKGIAVRDMHRVVANLAAAGIAVEAMCFTDFPTETFTEAQATLAFIKKNRDLLGLFICGCFDLVQGSRIAQNPDAYGITDLWTVEGDEFRTGLFYTPAAPWKTQREHEKIEALVAAVSQYWWLHQYPWAGALSTAHTQLYYERYGPAVFRKIALQRQNPKRRMPHAGKKVRISFDLKKIEKACAEHEAEIWHSLVWQERAVSRTSYQRLARTYPVLKRKGKV